MSEHIPQLPFHIDTGAFALGYYVVADIKYRTVQEFDTEAEAEEFVAKSNGTDVETVRRETTQLGRMLAQYRENLIRGSRERHKK
jgi:hypothetical protein